MKSDDVDRFLQTLAVSRTSRYTYATPLRSFRALARQRARGSEAISIATVRVWLERDAARSPLANIVQRMGIIGRYLAWRAAAGKGSNPLAELHRQYGRRLNPIVQALLEEDYEAAFERLRPPPEWGSPLGPIMREHITRMRSLGYRYEVKARNLRRLDRFLQRRADLAGEPLAVQLEAWSQSAQGLRHRLMVQQCARTLTRAMHRCGMNTPILGIETGLQRRVIQAERKPHLFTESEIARLFAAARTFPPQNMPLRQTMIGTMLTLAYCAGLRIGEIAALMLGDVDMENGVIEIRDTKFFKTRRLPLAANVMPVLSRYLAARQAAGAPAESNAPMWWSPRRRRRYSYSTLHKLLTRVIHHAGLKPTPGRRGPHVHDLRHTFVAHRMLRWYRDGVNPQSQLPHLATYLGHKDIISTLVYLTITPELLQQASERYRRRGADALRVSGGGR